MAAGTEHYVLEQGCQFLAFDYRHPGPQHDPAFRRAIRMALDRVSWVRELGGERIAPASGFSPRRSNLVPWSEASLDEALSLLDRSVYRGETLHLYYKPTPEATRDAGWVVKRCRAIGVRVTPHPLAAGTDAEPPATLLLQVETFGSDQAVSFVQMLAQEGSAVHRNLATRWADELSHFRDRLYAAPGAAERDEVAEAFEHWLEDDCKLLCNYHVSKRVGTPTALQGFQTADFGLPDLRRLWIRP